MALVRATCSRCGDIELRSNQLQIRICIDTNEATYSYRCPVCEMTEVKVADDHVVDILIDAHVHCEEWRLPAELNERPSGAPITHDDMLDFHELLAQPGDTWYILLLSMTPQ